MLVRTMHEKSGLLEAMEASTLTLADAGAQTLAFLRSHIPEAGKVPLAGNSIGTDRRFLATQLPAIEDYLKRETTGIARYVNELNEHSPFKDASSPPPA